MTRSWRVMPDCQIREYFARKAILWGTRETFCLVKIKLLYQILYPHYKYPHYPWNVWSSFQRENHSRNTWELEIVIPTYLYTFACGFSSTPTSPFPYHWEVNSPNTYHTRLECQVIIWYYWEALEEAKDGRCNMELVARSGELDKIRFREALLK